MNMNEGRDQLVTGRMRNRYIELAAMLKEAKGGTMAKLDKILSKFALQEGLKFTTAKAYLEAFKTSGLVVFTHGRKRWKYNPDAEWELFKVNI